MPEAQFLEQGANGWTGFKAVYSCVLLVFSVAIVMALIVEEKTRVSSEVHPGAALAVLWVALLWLAFTEGGQASMVGLPPIDRELYRESHPMTYRITSYHHAGDNLNRYLLGRQFMVLALVFAINSSGAPLKDADVWNLPAPVTRAFLKTGLAMIIFTCNIGQLNTQVNASMCMLDYINDWGNWFTIKTAMLIEMSGLLHASYLISYIVHAMAGKEVESNEPPRDGFTNLTFWARVVMSCAILGYAMTATLVALFQGKTTMWEGVPEVVALILFFLLMSVVGMLEGMQIAFFAVSRITDDERKKSTWAKYTCDILFEGDGHNLPGFMVGRQLCVVSCFFIIARVTSMDIAEGESNVLGVQDPVQNFFNTGLLGALITTIIASIAWQLVAGAFPIAFLSTPITYLLLRICLFLEATGLCQAAWVIAAIHRKFAGFQRDEVYVGTAEEREAMKRGDRKNLILGELAGGAYPALVGGPVHERGQWVAGGFFTERRSKVLRNISHLRENMELAASPEEKNAYQQALVLENAALQHINREEGYSFRIRKTGIEVDPTDEFTEEDFKDVDEKH